MFSYYAKRDGWLVGWLVLKSTETSGSWTQKASSTEFSALYTNLWHYIVYVIDGQLDMSDSTCARSYAMPTLLGTNR